MKAPFRPRALLTVGHDRALGVKAVRIHCNSLTCAHSAVVDLERLALPDNVAIIDIPKHRRFVCERCGSRDVSARSEFPGFN